METSLTKSSSHLSSYILKPKHSFTFSFMITESKAANAVGGKTARACDSCLRKRARWYCTSDDAFLCQGCDGSVHSANQLASRHERVRLGTASFRATDTKVNSPPAWHHGFTRKPRTQRQRKDRESVAANTSPMVPELGSEEASNDDSEEQLLYQVPVFDPFDAELSHTFHQTCVQRGKGTNEHVETRDHLDNLNGFLTSDMELAEFEADVESLLGTGLDEDSCGIEELGLMDCKEEDCFGGNRMKVEDEEVEAIIACSLDPSADMTREMLDWNFDYDESPLTGEEEEEKVVVVPETKMMNVVVKEETERKILLRLNYEEVITAWDNQRCPWTTGCRPEFNPNDCWLDFKVLSLSICIYIYIYTKL